MVPALLVEDAAKHYGRVEALAGVSLTGGDNERSELLRARREPTTAFARKDL